MKKLLLLLILPILFTSCSHYKWVRSSSNSYEPISQRQVSLTSTQPTNAEEIGMILCKSNKQHKSIRKARKKAAAHGANVIYMVNAKDQTAGQKISNLFLGTNMRGKYVFQAFRTAK